MDLPSVLGGLAQGFTDFGKSVVDLFGTGGAAIGDLLQGTGTRNQDDFRKWLYNTDSVKDAAAKGLGTALNGVQTISDYIPGINVLTRNPLGNAAQGALGGLADEFKMAGENYDLGRAGQRAAVSGAAALAGSSLGDALKKSDNLLLNNNISQGLARGAVSGSINQGGYAAIDGGDVWNSALQGAGMGALLGGATGLAQELRPRKLTPAEMALTDREKALRIANAKNMLDDAKYTIMSATPGDGTDIVAANNRVMELRKYITALENGYDNERDYDAAMAKRSQGIADTATSEVAPKSLDATLANADMAVNSPKLTPEQEAYFQNSVIRNSDGQLMPVYHSSPNKFTAFDDNMLGENTGYENTGYGHFVTPDKDFSARFKGDNGNTMELYANVKKPITHPYMAGLKYEGKELDDIVENWLKATGNSEVIDDLRLEAKANKTSLYDEYMNMMALEDVYEFAPDERKILQDAGYDAIELLEGRRNQLIDGSNDESPISSYAIFNGNQLKDINNLKPTSDVNIMASRMAPDEMDLARALAGQDMAVNSAKIAKNGGVNRIGSADVAPIDTKTLPKSLQAAQEYLNEGNYINDIEKFAGKPYSKLTNQDFLEYSLSFKNPEDKELLRTVIEDMVNDGSTTYEKYAASSARNRRLNKLMKSNFEDMDANSLGSYLSNNRTALNKGVIKDIDAELSDRLGIGRSNTLMRDNYLPPDALGAYDPANSTISINTNAPEENLVNTLAHERLHSFQTEGDFKRYDKRVTDAYDELSKDLSKYLKTPEETAKRYQFDADYWGNEREQQSRMLQQYLENKGFTKNGMQESNVGEWGNEINPAFDKFFDKLRDLSKRGVALPALATLFGGGALLATQNNDKEKEVK